MAVADTDAVAWPDSSALATRFDLDPDSPLLAAALTHRSASPPLPQSNERLEFLGDALLGMIVAKLLFDALPLTADEGVLTRARSRIIQQSTLAEAARALGIPALLRMGNGERKESRQEQNSVLADAFEALVAAISLENGQSAAAEFIAETLAQPLADVITRPIELDPKNRLQETMLARGNGLPRYVVVSESPPPDVYFVVEARAGDGPEATVLGVGDGPGKRIAERRAAVDSLTRMGESIG